MMLTLRCLETLICWGMGLYILLEARSDFRTGASYMARNCYPRSNDDPTGFWTAIVLKIIAGIAGFVLGVVVLSRGLGP